MRECGCHTRPSICRCLSKAKGGCVRSCGGVSVPDGPPDVLKDVPASTKGKIRDMVMISERPAEVEDRAVPGHWEGDLLMGRRQTAIGTLVERWSRYVMLFGLPDGNTAEAVRDALTQTVQRLPEHLWQSPDLGSRPRNGPTRPVHR